MIRGGVVRLIVKDVDAAVRFYIETLGMKLVLAEVGCAKIDAGTGFELVLRSGARGSAVAASSATGTSVGFRVERLADAVDIFENRGVTFSSAASGAANEAHFTDPDGNALYLYEGERVASPTDSPL